MSQSELLSIVERIVADAKPGEQVEAFGKRSKRTTARARKAEVESLEQATSAGIGVRVIKDGRVGIAYAGTLEEATSALEGQLWA